MAGRQVAERLQLARQLRERPRSTLDLRAVMNMDESMAPSGGQGRQLAVSRKAVAVGHDRRRAERTPQSSPLLWTVRLPWGGDADLVNISRTGILIESASQVSPGVALDLQLTARGVSRIVVARFVRSVVARADGQGARYHSAAQFEEPLDIVPFAPITPRATPQSLGDLFTSVVSESNAPEGRAAHFARGLRTLLGARDVLLRRTPMTPPESSESIYFTVKAGLSSPTILQVVLDRPPTAGEFSLMKAAAALTTAVLELEERRGERARSAEVA